MPGTKIFMCYCEVCGVREEFSTVDGLNWFLSRHYPWNVKTHVDLEEL